MSGNCTTTITVNCGNGGGGTTGAGSSNLLINGRGQINQRAYVSGTPTGAANEYTVDRWRVVTSGQNLSWVESEGTKTFTAPAGGVEQVIEGNSILTGTYVISFTGTATCEIDGVSKVSGDTVALTGGTNAVVKFSNDTFSLPQLQFGQVASAFEVRPVGGELALCQRYFYRYNDTVIISLSGQCQSATLATIVIRFPTDMRVNPEGVATGTFRVTPATGGAVFTTSVTPIQESTQGARIIANVAGGLVAGNATTFSPDNPGDFIDFDAEF